MTTVLHIIPGLKVGGAEMALLRLAAGSGSGPVKHVVASLTPEGAMRERFIEAGIELLVFDLKRAPVSSSWRLWRLIRQRKPHIVQTWMYHADLLGGLLARMAGCRHVIWGIRGTDVHDRRWATRLLIATCARLSGWVPSVIVCVAEAARRAHIGAGYAPGPMEVIPNGFDPARLVATGSERERLRAQCGLAPDHVAIGCVGRYAPIKDQCNFVRAAAIVAQTEERVRFLMVGRGVDHDNGELARAIAQSGCSERFTLLGERADIAVCLAAMDIFCLSSLSEGFPNVVGEAMSMARPCVVTDAGDAALLVGDTGAVVPVADSAALGAALSAMASLPLQDRQALGRRAQERIARQFTVAAAKARFAAVYARLLGATAPPDGRAPP